jgi:DNA polymerase III psi subunit
MSTETETTVEQNTDNVTGVASELRQTMGAVKLSFSWLGTRRKLSDTQTKQAAETFHAATELVTASKKLIDTSNSTYRTLTAIKSQAWSYWRSMTLPYPQEGVRLIKQADVAAFEDKMREYREQLAAAAANLQLEYEAIKEAAREKLGDLFNATDYPPTLEGVFEIKWEYPPVEPPNYLMTFNPELYAQEQTRIQQRFETAVIMAEDAFAEQLQAMITHLIERLTDEPDGTKKTFRATAVENFKEFCDNFRRMNVRSNAQLENLIQQANDLVAGVDIKDLRTNDNVRRNLSQQMATVQSALDNLITNAPRRRVLPMGGE